MDEFSNTPEVDNKLDLLADEDQGDYLDEDAKQKLRSLDPDFLTIKPHTEFRKNLSFKSDTKGNNKINKIDNRKQN